MNIYWDFNDYKIIKLNKDSKQTKINLDFFISKKCPQLSLGVYFNLNKFFVEKYISYRFNIQNLKISSSFKITSHYSIHKLRLEIVFENLEEYKHLQALREYIYLSILGVDNNYIFNDNVLKNLDIFKKKLVKDLDVKENDVLIDNILDQSLLSFSAFNTVSFDIFNKLNGKKLAKKYIDARGDVFNYMFKKNMYVETKFSNYEGFYKNIFTNISASYTYTYLNSTNVRLRALSKLTKQNKCGIIFSISCHYDLITQQIGEKMLNDAIDIFYKSLVDNKKIINYVKHNLDNESIIVLSMKTQIITQMFHKFFDEFCFCKIEEYKYKYMKKIINLVKTRDILEIVFICNYASVDVVEFERTLTNLQQKISLVDANKVNETLKYKQF